MAIERFFPQRAELTAALAAEITARVTAAVAERGAASLVVTGGSTPAPLYEALSRSDAPWDRTTLTLSDERWVDAGNPASNESMVRASLLKGAAADADLVGLKTAHATPSEALEAVSQAVDAIARPFDVVILGMGADAHIASLFPHAPELTTALDFSRPDLVCAVNRPDASGSAERVSLTLRALLDARLIVILIEGQAKRDTLARIEGADAADAPVQAILKQDRVPVEIWWAP